MDETRRQHPLERRAGPPVPAARRSGEHRVLVWRASGHPRGHYTAAELSSPDPGIARELREQAGLETLYDQSLRSLIVRRGNTRFRLTSVSVLYSLREVYRDAAYHFRADHDCAVLDIGANVGVSTLFFAEMRRVRRIYAYEPFAPHFAELLDNVALNPHLGDKITSRNEGAAACDVRAIVQAHPGLDLIAKVDCKGSEREVLEAWEHAGLFEHLRAILIEWHRGGPDALTAILVRQGYVCLLPGNPPSDCGIIYAFQQPPGTGRAAPIDSTKSFTAPGEGQRRNDA